MGLLDLFQGKFVDPTYPGVHAGGNVITTTLDAVVKWGRRSSIWPMPFGTACCAIEFMALSASHYDIARFGAEVLRFSPRQADLMFVAGTIPDKLAPVLKTVYDQMPEPKWVISMGVCASSGGFYRSYHVMQGIDEIIPVDVYVPGCPPSPEGLLAAVMKIQEKIKNGEQAKEPQGAHRLGAPGAGAIDRRTRREAWAQDDAARQREGKRPRGVLELRCCLRTPRTSSMASTTAAAPPEVLAKPAARILSEALGERVLSGLRLPRRPRDQRRARGAWLEAARLLRDHPELDYKLFLDLCAVDHLDRPGHAERFEIVLHAYSVSKKHHVRLKTPVPESDPKLPTLVPVWRGANWFEREAWDLYGVVFEGHPNLSRLLTHDDFVGHPMRKDYPTAKRHVLKVPKEFLLQGPAGLGAPADQHRPLAPCDARHLPRAGAARRRDDHARPRPRSATCTATSRRWRRSGATGRSSRTPTGSTTARRS